MDSTANRVGRYFAFRLILPVFRLSNSDSVILGKILNRFIEYNRVGCFFFVLEVILGFFVIEVSEQQ